MLLHNIKKFHNFTKLINNLIQNKNILNTQMLALRHNKFTNLLSLSRKFSSNTTALMEDWQIINLIQQNLKQGNINSAMRYLIKSHLQKQILDMQTFRNMHYKMVDLKADISYQQLTYKLYRQYFKPHVLMLQWMKLLTYTKDKATLQIIQKDYQQLNVEMPKVVHIQQQIKQSVNESSKEKVCSVNEMPLTTQNVEENLQKAHNKESKKITAQRKQISITDKQLIDEALPIEQFKDFIEGLLNKDMNIVVSDVQIICENFLQDEDMTDDYDQNHNEHEQQYEQYDQNHKDLSNDKNNESSLAESLSSISRIKIGKIQIRSKSDKDDDDKN